MKNFSTSVLIVSLLMILNLTLSLKSTSFNTKINLDDPRIPKIDELFKKYTKPGMPGVSVGIIEEGNLVYHKSFGVKDLSTNNKIDKNSRFLIGSTSKQFTCLIVALLEEEGLIDTSVPLSRYLPNIHLARFVNIDQLMKHTSGLKDYLNLAILKDEDVRYFGFSRDYAVDEIVKHQRGLNFQPNTEFMYSNTGYLLIELVIEKVTGKSFTQVLQEKIFDPLGMSSTVLHDQSAKIIPNVARAYQPQNVQNGKYIEAPMITDCIAGAGGIFTTIEDFLKYDKNYYDNKLGSRGQELIKKITTPGRFANGTAHNYGYGLFIDNTPYGPRVHHGGGWPGYLTAFSRFPEKKVTFLIFSNGGDYEAVLKEHDMAKIWFGLDSKFGFYPPTPYQFIMNEMLHQPQYLSHLVLGNKKLMAKYIQQSSNEISADRYVGYYYSNELKVTYHLVKEAHNVLSFKLKYAGKAYLILKGGNNHEFWLGAPNSGNGGFFTESNGKISGLTLEYFPRANNIRYLKVERSPIC